VIRFILSRDGWQVSHQTDGALALARVQALRPDLIIPDLMLPNLSGLEILVQIRSDPIIEALPMLMLTARGQERDREAAVRVGVDRFMARSFSNAEILAEYAR